MLTLQSDTLDRICFHAQTEYPGECCGVLLGRREEGQRIAYRIIQTTNSVGGGKRTMRFQIDPLELAKAELEAEREQLEIVGFYHSHPNHEAVPSCEDTRCMIAGYSYPIVSVQHGSCFKVRSYTKARQTDAYAQEESLVKEKRHADFGICIGNLANLCE